MALSHMVLEVTSVPLVLLKSKSRPVHTPGRACTGAYPGGRIAGPAGGRPRRCALHWGGGADNTGQRQTQDRVTRPDGRQRTVREALGTSEVRGRGQEGTPRPRPAQHLALEQSPCPRVPWARQQAAGHPLVLKDGVVGGGKLRLSHHVGGACSILGPQDLLSMQCLSCPFVHMGAEFPGLPHCPHSLCSPRAGGTFLQAAPGLLHSKFPQNLVAETEE